MSLALQFILITLLFQFQFAITSTSNPSGLSIKATVHNSPQSPLYQIENLTIAERVEKLIKITKSRVNYLESVSYQNAKLTPNNIHIGIYREDLFYAVGFTMGSQRQVKLLLDTGGGLTWTQCQPCRRCFHQTLPIFDPRLSSTYGTVPCDHPYCEGPYSLYDCENGLCVYDAQYGGGASTNGVASFESFQFLMSDGSIRSFSNVIFGCSYESSDFAYKNTDISGIFGLNTSPDSMSSQFSPLINSRFSYCFIPFFDAIPRPLVLRFGEDIPQPPHLQSTLLLWVTSRPHLYFLELLDITVANHRIGFQPDTFQIRPDGSGGMFIDSGCLFSLIDTNTIGINAYQTVMRVFRAYYGSRGLQRTQSVMGFELCYEIPPTYNDFASITFHFNGADYTVDGENGHLVLSERFCVAIGKKAGKSVLGAWQQQNKRIIYDRSMGVLQFADEQCINDVL
ncbi:Peptidase A1 [Corchorus olitorius]|uniref:Peptidase A1 n=1 Tax=Corchorus olitorius TaxID=93759 RepID=A0A1R3KBN1_9ROSI|nr:Peptidase A1 [Corchorus olitorius]